MTMDQSIEAARDAEDAETTKPDSPAWVAHVGAAILLGAAAYLIGLGLVWLTTTIL